MTALIQMRVVKQIGRLGEGRERNFQPLHRFSHVGVGAYFDDFIDDRRETVVLCRTLRIGFQRRIVEQGIEMVFLAKCAPVIVTGDSDENRFGVRCGEGFVNGP